jgi:hypothetical protein
MWRTLGISRFRCPATPRRLLPKRDLNARGVSFLVGPQRNSEVKRLVVELAADGKYRWVAMDRLWVWLGQCRQKRRWESSEDVRWVDSSIKRSVQCAMSSTQADDYISPNLKW